METPDWFKRHEEDDKKHFGAIESALHRIENNHLNHMESDLKTISIATAQNTTNTDWLKWLVGFILVGILGIAWATIKV